jgi:hypothetical protein
MTPLEENTYQNIQGDCCSQCWTRDTERRVPSYDVCGDLEIGPSSFPNHADCDSILSPATTNVLTVLTRVLPAVPLNSVTFFVR